ncbi:glycosyltransferase family 39 protein [candidate division WOR-3 bacterium]|nr:glycosyltransferase family 39 protein [candidate division WOR-3 bacterium]
MKKTKIELLLVVGVILVTTLPFVNKAFHIDDGVFLDTAKEIRQHPLYPYSAFTKGYGVQFNRFEDMPHPPLFMYLLSIFLLNKISEPLLHIFSFLFAILAGVSAYFLAKRFTRQPLFTTLLFISSPMFIISSHNIMTDMPALALCLASITAFIYGMEKNDTKALVLASILIGVASLIRYISLILFPLLLVYSILYRKSFLKTLWVLLGSFLIFSIWPIQNLLFYKKFLLFASGDYVFSPGSFKMLSILRRGTSDLASIGGATVFPIFLIGIYLRNLKGKIVYLFTALGSIFAMFALRIGNYAIGQKFLLFLFLSIGIFITYKFFKRIIVSQSQKTDAVFLTFWYIIVLLLTIIAFPFGCARYMLPLLFPLIIIFINEVDEIFQNKQKVFCIVCGIGISLTFITGIVIALSDYEYAGVYRKFVKESRITNYLPDGRQAGESRFTTWFVGEWGFRYYMEREGYSYLLSSDNSPKEGDILVIPTIPCPWKIDSKLKVRIALIKTEDYKGRIPIKVMNPETHTGFYSSGFGLLPYSFSTEKLESFNIYRVIK